jgi:RimJ/RimL family protein N-acetyltransferase
LVEDGNGNFGAGFRKEGIMRDTIYRDGAYHSLVLMSLLESEYRSNT